MKIIEKLFDNDNQNIIGLTSELRGFYAYNKFKKTNHSVLYVTSSTYEANVIYQTVLNYTDKVLFFPMDDFLTSEALAISPEFLLYRLNTLNKLLDDNYIVITNMMGLLRILPSKNTYLNSIIHLKKGNNYELKNLVNNLYEIGYIRESLVNKSGEIAVRGFVLDIFLNNLDNPIRIEFFGDEIEKISEFDVDTQRTFKNLDEVTIYPNTEFIAHTEDEHKQYNLYKYCECSSIKDYLLEPIIIVDNYTDFLNNYRLLETEISNYRKENNISKGIKFMYNLDDINIQNSIKIESFNNFDFKKTDYIDYHSKTIDNFKQNINELGNYLYKYILKNKTIVLCFSNKINARKINELLKNYPVVSTTIDNLYDKKINIVIYKIQTGFEINDIMYFSEKELFNKKDINYNYKNRFRMGNKIRDINKIKKGDYIVHYSHGIGIYQGIKTLEKNGLKRDYIMLEYKDGDKLYVPVEKIELISKYSANEGLVPKINKLGTSDWQKTKLRVKKRIEIMAEDLLKLYSEREAAIGISFKKDTEEQLAFESYFPYNETPDQLKAINEIKKDMENPHPMDRLLCGDVGYGKTEVAFRAIFKAIMSNKQAVILCPTTILSSQHYNNAIERFKNFPINIEILNRFVPNRKQKEIIENLKKGTIDLLIGTHRVLGKDIGFKRLGLLIIDEEQRFGVRHKEKIKEYKNNIDVLTLTATPIPRTLQMSLSGIRGLSLIETPPIDRYPVQTYVLEENQSILKDAIYKEVARNGQIFILFNNIQDMESKRSEISNLIPNLKIAYIHGKMEKNTIENIMNLFQNKEYDILLCTTIIETGIDIPNVNTLIVIDADHFGLSQLYQIRGRVGRSNKIAYCYLMYKKGKLLSDVAKKRLTVIKDFTELGSGFSIAMRDLSIRGAGDILGGEQSGFVDSIGADMFFNMLNEEINKLKGIKTEAITEGNLPLVEVSNSISDSYVEEEDLKIEIHKLINSINSIDDLNNLQLELEDRFGKLNEEMIIYMYEQLFEKKAEKLKVTNIKQQENLILITLPKIFNDQKIGDKLFMDIVSLNRNFSFSMRFGNIIISFKTNNLDKHYIYYLNDLMDILENLYNNHIR